MQRTRSSAFALQFDHVGYGAPDVLLALGAPLVGPFAHRRGRRNRINGNHFVEAIGNGSSGFISVENHRSPCHGGPPQPVISNTGLVPSQVNESEIKKSNAQGPIKYLVMTTLRTIEQ